MKKTISNLIIILFALIILVPNSFAMKYFYVDPDWSGNLRGTASEPWNRCDLSAQWSEIDDTLKYDNVTVYFSSKSAISNENQKSFNQIKILRTNIGNNRLILDGMSQFNENDSNPLWKTSEFGYNHHIIHNNPITTTTSTTKRSYVTIKGFKLQSQANQGIYYWGGDHVIIEDNEVDQTNAKYGPGVYFQYARKVGDWEIPCVPDVDHNCGLTDITIKNNIIHDTYGECLYIGGVNERKSSSEPVNILHRIDEIGHTDITISGNTIFDCGVKGGEGDGIDIKSGNENILVSGNTVYMTRQGEGVDGIIIDAGAIVENNFVYNFGKTGINMSAYWNTRPTRDNSIIRNNIVANTGGNPIRSIDYGIYVQGAGIEPGYDEFTNIKIFNNTITGIEGDFAGDGGGLFIAKEAKYAIIKNNIIAKTNSIPLVVEDGNQISEHSNNLFFRPIDGELVKVGNVIYNNTNLNQFEPSALKIDPLLITSSFSQNPGDYRATAYDTRGAGSVLTEYVPYDFFWYSRSKTSWDIGAIIFDSQPNQSYISAPKSLKIVK